MSFWNRYTGRNEEPEADEVPPNSPAPDPLPVQLRELEDAFKAAITRVEDAAHQAILRIELGLNK